MALRKDNNTRKEFHKITISLASPETILEQSHGEVLKPEQEMASVCQQHQSETDDLQRQLLEA